MTARIPMVKDAHTPMVWESGDLATYYSAFGGPVPCRVLGKTVRRNTFGLMDPVVVVQFTAHRRGHTKGMVELVKIDSNRASSELFARNTVRVSSGKYIPRVHAHDVSELPVFNRENFPRVYNLAGFSARF